MRLVDGAMFLRLGEVLAELEVNMAILRAQSAIQENRLLGGPDDAALIWSEADREYLRLQAIGELAYLRKES